MRSKDGEALKDIATNIGLLRSMGPKLSIAHFETDWVAFYALAARHPQAPWAQIRAAGNVYRHECRDVLEEFVIDVATRQLDALEQAIAQEIDRNREPP
jgi:hypothetical protein